MNAADRIEHIIVPPAMAPEIVRTAKEVYLRDCPCRARQQACPRDTWEVCLLFEHAAADDRRDARSITTGEALALLRTTGERGAIYQVFYTEASRRVTEGNAGCLLEEMGNWMD